MERSTSNAATGTKFVPCPSSSNKTSKRVGDSIAAYTVQCGKCSKWRFIPTKEKYEEIREMIAQQPFLCETAREWRPDITCDDEQDLVRDGSWRWAIDKPSIPQPPPGWQWILRIRAEGGTKFADVYLLRCTIGQTITINGGSPEVSSLDSHQQPFSYRYEHPELGVNLSQFSFQTPAPLEEDYVRKRRAGSATLHDVSDTLMPDIVIRIDWNSFRLVAASPISWIAPDQSRDLHFGGEGTLLQMLSLLLKVESGVSTVDNPLAASYAENTLQGMQNLVLRITCTIKMYQMVLLLSVINIVCL
ncbi:Methyl-CpG-binding domain-containing protein 2 [Abeliophyllum distichum]|uniref:Methyl-CpG-binding domain-containing protein 2 n=1 Tax=Abeliophyllum distichum TaxID=126358 RepID=A0ABD1QZL9_9LAMI